VKKIKFGYNDREEAFEMEFVKGRKLQHNQKVFVYFNLHKKVFSIKSLEGKFKGKVVAHTKELSMNHCRFKVSKAGRARVLKNKQKNVHAGVVGYIDLHESGQTTNNEITYNPYDYETFVYKKSLQPIYESKYAYLQNKKVYV
jgi:hypothetical protein